MLASSHKCVIVDQLRTRLVWNITRWKRYTGFMQQTTLVPLLRLICIFCYVINGEQEVDELLCPNTSLYYVVFFCRLETSAFLLLMWCVITDCLLYFCIFAFHLAFFVLCPLFSCNNLDLWAERHQQSCQYLQFVEAKFSVDGPVGASNLLQEEYQWERWLTTARPAKLVWSWVDVIRHQIVNNANWLWQAVD